MPRRNRPDSGDDAAENGLFVSFVAQTQTRRGRQWTVQPITATAAVKAYRCPGCNGDVAPGTPHVVAWPADGVLGDAADLASRRHWHSQCWRIS